MPSLVIKNKKDHAFSHVENRCRVCLLCSNKNKCMVKITEKLHNKLDNFIKIDLNDDRFPNVLCTTCSRKLYETCSIKNSNKKNCISFEIKDYFKFLKTIRTTRSSVDKVCICHLCKLAQISNKGNALCRKKGRFLKNKKIESVKFCDICFSPTKKGLNHDCTPLNRVVNIKNYIIDNCEIDEKEKITSMLIKKKLISKSKNNQDDALEVKQFESNTIALTQRRGQPLKVTVSPTEKEKLTISTEDMFNLKTRYNLSDNVTRSIAKDLRNLTKNRKLIASGLNQKNFSKNHVFDDFFVIKKFNFKYKNSKINVENILPETVVYCKDLNKFIQHISKKRSVSNYHLKFGIDGGRGFLKVCLSIQDKSNLFQEAEQKKYKKQTFLDGAFVKKFKDTGVKKLFIVAISQNTQENYENVSDLWQTLKINDFHGTFATDLKLANIMLGIMSHSSLYPCTWCFCNKNNLINVGELRTTSNCQKYYEAWVLAGSDPKKSKNFMNCIHPPVFKRAEETKILDIIPPSELHLMLGVVNTLINHMTKEYEADADIWIKVWILKLQI